MHKESESGRRVSGRQAEAESRSRHREQLEFLFGWNFLDVSGMARAAAGKVGSGHPVQDLGLQDREGRLWPAHRIPMVCSSEHPLPWCSAWKGSMIK